MVEKAINARLLASAGVIALVVARIYPELAPQNAVLPYIVYTRVDTEHLMTKDNAAALANARIQINSVAATYLAVKQLADQVRLALQGWSGTGNGVTVKVILPGNDFDAPVFAGDGTDETRKRVIQDFKVWFVEDNPS